MATKTKTNVNTEIPVINNPELLKVIKDRIAYKRMIEEAEAILKGLDQQIKDYIEETGEVTFICGEHKVSYSKYTRESISAKDVKKYISDEVFNQIVSRTVSTRLTVK